MDLGGKSWADVVEEDEQVAAAEVISSLCLVKMQGGVCFPDIVPLLTSQSGSDVAAPVLILTTVRLRETSTQHTQPRNVHNTADIAKEKHTFTQNYPFDFSG